MKKIDVVEEALQDIRDIFEDVVILKQETVESVVEWDSWYMWAIEYLQENLSIPEEKAKYYMEKLNAKTHGNSKKKVR